MSIEFITYDPITGAIEARRRASDPAQILNYPFAVLISSDDFLLDLENRKIVSGGVLVDLPRLEMTADKLQIASDGADKARVTFSGLSAPLDVRVAGRTVRIDPADPVLDITSDVPTSFVVEPIGMGRHWIEPASLAIEAV